LADNLHSDHHMDGRAIAMVRGTQVFPNRAADHFGTHHLSLHLGVAETMSASPKSTSADAARPARPGTAVKYRGRTVEPAGDWTTGLANRDPTEAALRS
jgi:hypothetical protein